MSKIREGSLEAPTRHPLGWQAPTFYDEAALQQEMARVFDICHGCRRCVNLCQAFPTLFDLIDASETMEVDGVDPADYGQVVRHCYLCDLCYMTKCPYVPPHEFDVDFPQLMLRAKAVHFKRHGAPLRDRLLADTDRLGRLAGIPVVSRAVNAANASPTLRGLMEKALGIAADAPLPPFAERTLSQRLCGHETQAPAQAAEGTQGRVGLIPTCYGEHHQPALGEDLVAVFEHNHIPVRLVDGLRCCGMPRLELGDLEAVDRARAHNVPRLLAWVEQGWDLVAPVPSCVLMYKQTLPLMFPEDEAVKRLAAAVFDPFEYLMRRHKAGLLDTAFKVGLGTVAYHAPCHLRVQNMGLKTREFLALIPGTRVEVIERCSGHDGTYAVKRESHEASLKICRPVAGKVRQLKPDLVASDCPMAATQIHHALGGAVPAFHPLALARRAYDL